MTKILVTGACGQIGSELVPALRSIYGKDNVIATGHITKPTKKLRNSGPFYYLNIMDKEQLAKIVMDNDVDTIYHLASILSAIGEQNPQLCYEVNMNGFYNILEVTRKYKLKLITASSIAVFGQNAPKFNTPNDTIMFPETMYGITKVCEELLGNYYSKKYGVDFRCVRFPGIISSETKPGGGTTDYTVEMFYAAVEGKHYTCFVRKDTVLPIMYMPDAIKALINLAKVEESKLKHRVFNVNSMSFSAGELEEAIKKFIPTFSCEYKPDYRQIIADSWPKSLDDSIAREEWGWKPEFNDLNKVAEDMIKKLKQKFKLLQNIV
ncbi:MAG: NAD-dependent epimerase/dehydratase family protein [Candidatus Bathyarchaeia archaeon]